MIRLLLILSFLVSTAVFAAPQPVRLSHDETEVSFGFRLAGIPRRGTMPLQSSNVILDLSNLSNSSVLVELDARRVSTGLGLLDQELREDDMLDTARFPTIRFESTSISGSFDNAVMRGNLTVKGVTRPVTLRGGIFRPAGSDINNMSRLVMRAAGELDRRDFGMDAFPELVPPQIAFNVEAIILR